MTSALQKQPETAARGGTCTAVCWVIGIVVGGYAAYALVTDFQIGRLQSAAIGIAALLVIAVVLRGLFCHGHRDRVRERVAAAREADKDGQRPAVMKSVPLPHDPGTDDNAADAADADLPAAPAPAAPAPTVQPLAPKPVELPEGATPDDFSRIDRLGEAQVQALHDAGIFHFSQLVRMNRRELAWIDQNIPNAAAADWRKQAIALSKTP